MIATVHFFAPTLTLTCCCGDIDKLYESISGEGGGASPKRVTVRPPPPIPRLLHASFYLLSVLTFVRLPTLLCLPIFSTVLICVLVHVLCFGAERQNPNPYHCCEIFGTTGSIPLQQAVLSSTVTLDTRHPAVLSCVCVCVVCFGAAHELLLNESLHSGEGQHHDRKVSRPVRHATRRHRARNAVRPPSE